MTFNVILPIRSAIKRFVAEFAFVIDGVEVLLFNVLDEASPRFVDSLAFRALVWT